ncbi:MAG: LysR family transcriptional regulator [Solirubrobacteraceae bacterium]
MELRHLGYFVAVADELHFRRAAEWRHVAQPAVSEQVRKLEDELGVRLLDRSERSVSLTDAGAALLTEARRVLHDAEAARLAARHANGRAHGEADAGHDATRDDHRRAQGWEDMPLVSVSSGRRMRPHRPRCV